MNKQQLPLLIIHLNGGKLSSLTRLQKLVFLSQQEIGEEYYDFEDQETGPLSVGLYDEIRELYEDGYLNIEKTKHEKEIQYYIQR